MLYSLRHSSLRQPAPGLSRRPDRHSVSRFSLYGLLSVCLLSASAAFGGTWTQVSSSNPEYYSDTMLLQTDGSVMVLSGWDYQTWTKLTPDSTGSYVNGTWTTLKNMSIPRQNFGSTVMTDGRVLVLGGQYSGPNLTQNDTNTGEIYDPVTNKWSPISPYPETKFGAGPLVLHQFGYVLAGGQLADTYFYYPPSDFWFTYGNSLTGDPKLRNDVNTQETWLLMPDGSVMSYDVNASITNSAATAQKFTTSSAAWVDAATLPFLLSTTAQNSRMGPGTMLPNGKLLQIGANELTGIYSPGPNSSSPGSWVTGPSLPAGRGADNAPGAMLPDGHFYFLADYYPSGSPTALFDYNYFNNTLTDITDTLPINLYYELYFSDAASCRMLVLPSGGLLLSTAYNSFWEYKTSGSPLNTWRPTINSITKTTASKYSLQGSRLNGISEGATYGANARMSTNYPIVRLDQVGSTRYARTTGWTPGLSYPGINNFQSVTFEVPGDLTTGTYYASVITNGIQSLSVPITFTRGNVNVSYSGGILNINGDAEANNIQVTYKQVKVSGVLKSASVTVTAGDAFTTVNGQTSVTLDVGIERFNTNVQMGAGSDVVSISSLYAKGMIVNLADGDDTLTLSYNSILNQLIIDGGTGFDTVTLTGNSVGSQSMTNVP